MTPESKAVVTWLLVFFGTIFLDWLEEHETCSGYELIIKRTSTHVYSIEYNRHAVRIALFERDDRPRHISQEERKKLPSSWKVWTFWRIDFIIKYEKEDRHKGGTPEAQGKVS